MTYCHLDTNSHVLSSCLEDNEYNGLVSIKSVKEVCLNFIE